MTDREADAWVDPISQMTFEKLTMLAREVVEAVLKKLPTEVRAAATAVPVTFEAVPGEELIADGLDADILGLFVGADLGGDPGGDQPFPPQILLFLENILDFAEGREAGYRREVRLTYLHELGHYFGWNEEEVALRGLE